MKYTTSIGVHEELGLRKDIPSDYHCTCTYCTSNYIGEIYDVVNDQYYSQSCRSKYYPKLKEKHLCPGHWEGYRFAVLNFSSENDWVFDPSAGSGSTIIEAINNKRNGFGIEYEFSDIAMKNIEYQYQQREIKNLGLLAEGDARDLTTILNKYEIFNDIKFSLIINGPPYPKIGAKSSDAPERGSNSFDYIKKGSFGLLNGEDYWNSIIKMYVDAIEFLKPTGKLVIIIKDLVQNKKAYLLHKEVVDRVLSSTNKLRYHGCYIHKHIPPTMFINTYNKRFPDIKIPLYQTAIILERV